MGCWFRIFAVDIQVLSGRQHGEMTSSRLVRIFTMPRAASQHFNRKKLGANIAIHHNRVIPNFRVYLSYGVAARVVRSVNQKAVEYTARQQNMELLPAEINLLIPWGSTEPSILVSCKPTFANMAISSFSEKYISPRGFNQMKNDRVRCLTSKLSKRMI